MCGIIGYAGGGDAAKIIYEGLKRLEYRGYDSAGLAVLQADGKITVVKRQGRVEKLLPCIEQLSSSVGIGHTRWATHGKPTDANAHPHSAGAITIVHNGIIENYAELKEELIKKGEIFFSETDSEVIARLLSKNFYGDLLSALSQTVKLLKGSYALMVMCQSSQTIAAARYKSPLIVGYGEGENYFASDQPALAGKCKKISILQDGDFALLSKDGVKIYDGNLKEVKRQKLNNLAVSASLDLDGCPHYMLKEIRQVPASVKNTYCSFFETVPAVKAALAGVERVIITGCGTAYHAGLVGKRYFQSFAGIPAEVETAAEFRYNKPVITPHTAVIAISQSGETADTVEAARLALSLGAKVIAVTNAPYSQLTRLASAVVPVEAGVEICVAATKSYAGQIAALYLVARVFGGEDLDGENIQKLESLPAVLSGVVNNINVNSLAHMCASAKEVFFLGKDLDYALALEASLKLKEVSYVPSEGYPAGELKHGTLALVDENTVSIAIITDEELAGKCENAVHEVTSRGGAACVITNVEGTQKRLAGKAEVIMLPACDKFLSPLIAAVAVQYIAYYTAVILGRDPDKPRNLAKSVTVE